MKVCVTPLTGWKDVKRAAFATMWRCPDGDEPTSLWKRRILIARHSPIESLMFRAELYDLPYWVSVHFIRHKIGVSHYVSTQRDDRHDNPKPRAEMPQGTFVNHTMVLNAQAIIAISKKRLCKCASKETRDVWLAVKGEMEKVDREMAWAMRPECDWSGGRCPEMRGCGDHTRLDFFFWEGGAE